MNHIKLLDNLSDHDKTTVAMTLLFQKLNPEQKNYIAGMSEGMLKANEMFENAKEIQKN